MIHLHTSTLIADTYRRASLTDLDASALAFAIDYETREFEKPKMLLPDAMALAAFAHLPQTRPGRHGSGTDPYVTHPFRNVLRLVRYGCTNDEVLAATALHDTVEDQADRLVAALSGGEPSRERALELIGQCFTERVAEVVDAVTNPPKPDGLSREEKNALYKHHVAGVIQDPHVFLVKLSDFIDNAGSLHNLADETKRNRLRDKYTPLVPVFVDARNSLGDAVELSTEGYVRLDSRLARLADSLA